MHLCLTNLNDGLKQVITTKYITLWMTDDKSLLHGSTRCSVSTSRRWPRYDRIWAKPLCCLPLTCSSRRWCGSPITSRAPHVAQTCISFAGSFANSSARSSASFNWQHQHHPSFGSCDCKTHTRLTTLHPQWCSGGSWDGKTSLHNIYCNSRYNTCPWMVMTAVSTVT